MKKMIFHYSGQLYDVQDTGEKKRPSKMIEAFREIGFQVETVTGTLDERKMALGTIKKCINEFSFLYSESSSIPLMLSSDSHVPLLNGPDIELFRLCKKAKLPCGVFYRDIYWRYSSFSKTVGMLKHILSVPFYIHELFVYKKYMDCVFVPSQRFAEKVPIISKEKMMTLPPGCDIPENLSVKSSKNKDTVLRLLYVGSVAPPIYDISAILDYVSGKASTQMELTIVTRRPEWGKYSSRYRLADNVKVMHVSGDKLKALYENSDLFLICLKNDKYRELCMPLKLFEAFGNLLPVLSCGDNAVSDFVEKHQIGWAENNIEDAYATLDSLAGNRDEIQRLKAELPAIIKENTWKTRAEKVEKTLGRR
ncbi:MAG: hypothetical protein A2020_07475 [Lentisphaerae bacterium GWF2_45_14]|nr:MAG: hypothetical protein A2020_07475 [Lentisphaerae bacterium GWF2_45_14]